ncbi:MULTISPECIES: hypothetical protein [Paracoccus]|uniref:hypothetical protein n=1 Tax=Paracoccus TaxID=265 RepID=UPI000FDB3834|nr:MULTISPECIES: hypothetical protein [Paracoccus]AZY93889.1 hypothetical protein EOJ32_09600 [Paracoccus sp. Arc7-R13]TNC04422.1 hypothetical protein FHD68_06130 [Paracoccus marcusii]
MEHAILVVSKVSQPDDRGACMMGCVPDHDGAAANRRARRIADGTATHDCAHDRTVVEPSAAKVPPR